MDISPIWSAIDPSPRSGLAPQWKILSRIWLGGMCFKDPRVPHSIMFMFLDLVFHTEDPRRVVDTLNFSLPQPPTCCRVGGYPPDETMVCSDWQQQNHLFLPLGNSWGGRRSPQSPVGTPPPINLDPGWFSAWYSLVNRLTPHHL